MLRAGAAAGIAPVLLEHVVVVAKGLIVLGGSCSAGSRAQAVCIAGGGGAEVEIALVGVFLAAGIKPGVQIRIRDGFFQFMGDHVGHAVNAADVGCRAVRTSSLDFAAGGAAIHVADERVLDVGTAQSRARVEAAVLCAES